MKLSAKQRTDLDTVKYFVPSGITYTPITEEDVERYFQWSDRGIGGQDIAQEAMGMISRGKYSGMAALYWGKQRRDLQVTSYIEDWGTYITSTDFADEPRFLVEWLAKVMKKPGLLVMWKAFNCPDEINNDETADILEHFGKFFAIIPRETLVLS